MNDIKPGVIDAFRDAAKVIADAVEPLMDVFYGVEIRRSAHVARGTTVRLPRKNGRGVIVMHPLDAIAAELRDDPIAQLDEIAAYFAEKAHRELDDLLGEVDDELDACELGQHLDMRRWMVEHGVDEAELVAAVLAHRLDPGNETRIELRFHRAEVVSQGVQNVRDRWDMGPVW